MAGRRVVVTGIGTINPIGNNIEEYFSNLEKGVSGAAPITHFNAEKFKTQFACEVKNYDPSQYFDRKEVRKYDLFTQYAWGYVEPLSMTPTWVHFDRRYGKPACPNTTAGYPTCRRGNRSTYVLILQDALNALGYPAGGLDGIFGARTETALKGAQRAFGLTADGICGCASWRKIAAAAVGIGRTQTVVDS